MTLIKCPECGKAISNKAVSCPNCGLPMSLDRSGASAGATNEVVGNHKEGDSREKGNARHRISKGSCGKFKFYQQDGQYVFLKCTTCGEVLAFRRDLFVEIDDGGATPLEPLACPRCSPDSSYRKGRESDAISGKEIAVSDTDKNGSIKGEKDIQSTIQNIGCGALLLFPVLGFCGLISTFVGSSVSMIPVYLMIASLVCLVVGWLLYWLGSPPKTLEQEQQERMQAKERADKEKYNDYKYTCPMCGSRKIKNIGTGKKLAGVATVGLASKSIGKNYRSRRKSWCKRSKLGWL